MQIVHSILDANEKPKVYKRSKDRRFIEALAIKIRMENNERLRKQIINK